VDRVLSVMTDDARRPAEAWIVYCILSDRQKTWQRPTLPRLETQYHGR